MCHFMLLYIAALRTKCAADLDELLEFKVKQYVQGIVIHNYTMHDSVVHTHRCTSNGGQI